MVDSVVYTLWIWDPIIFIAFYLFSFVFWYLFRNGTFVFNDDNNIETTIAVKNPFWIGISICCMSFFFIGLYSLYLFLAYFFSVGLIKAIHKFKEIE